jgi:acyl-coenzyme A synthetase/AMP-(fatty) acid ligase
LGFAVAAGLRCTLANSAYNARELGFQYADSGAKLVFTSEEGIPVVLEMLKAAGLNESEVRKRIVVLTTSLHWAGDSYVPVVPTARGFTTLSDLLGHGALAEEEKFDGQLSNETVYLCYSSGTTGKPKGVEVRDTCYIQGWPLTRF